MGLGCLVDSVVSDKGCAHLAAPLCAEEVPVLCKGQDQRVPESLGPTWMNRRGK